MPVPPSLTLLTQSGQALGSTHPDLVSGHIYPFIGGSHPHNDREDAGSGDDPVDGDTSSC